MVDWLEKFKSHRSKSGLDEFRTFKMESIMKKCVDLFDTS